MQKYTSTNLWDKARIHYEMYHTTLSIAGQFGWAVAQIMHMYHTQEVTGEA